MTERFMLDTNIVSHTLQGKDAGLLARLGQITVGQAVISNMVIAAHAVATNTTLVSRNKAFAAVANPPARLSRAGPAEAASLVALQAIKSVHEQLSN